MIIPPNPERVGYEAYPCPTCLGGGKLDLDQEGNSVASDSYIGYEPLILWGGDSCSDCEGVGWFLVNANGELAPPKEVMVRSQELVEYKRVLIEFVIHG